LTLFSANHRAALGVYVRVYVTG